MCVTWIAHLYITEKLGVLHLTRTPRLSEVFIGQLLSVFHLKGVGVYLSVLCHHGLKFFENRVSKDTNC